MGWNIVYKGTVVLDSVGEITEGWIITQGLQTMVNFS